jgi:superfamily II DNA or RNA helicase
MTALARALSPYFKPEIRGRGAGYYRSGRVRIQAASDWHVAAMVRGSDRYDVELKRNRDEVHATCTCPHFGRNLCKHIWASVLAADAEQWLRGDQRGGAVRLSGGQPAARAGHERDRDDEPIDVPTRQPRHPPARPKPTSDESPGWRTRLRRLREAQAPHSVEHPWPETRELLYVIDASAAPRGEELALELWSTDLRKDGTRSKPKLRGVPRRLLGDLPSADDRYILAFLTGATELHGPSASFSPATDEGDPYPTRYRLVEPQPAILFPALCRTGRCRLRLHARDDATDWRPVTWDAGEPWQLRLEVSPHSNGRKYRLTGALHRGTERMELDTPALLTSGGLVFTRDTIARFDAHDALAWMTLLREQSELVVPKSAGDELVAELMRQPSLPPLDLPVELRYQEARGTPEPRLTLQPALFFGRRDRLTGTVEFDYGGTRVPSEPETRAVLQPAERRLVLRDLAAERAALEALGALGWRRVRDGYTAMESGTAFELAGQRLPAAVRSLVGAGWRVEIEGQAMRTAVDFDLAVTSGIDWFELHGTLAFGDGAAAHLPQLLAAARRGEDRVTLDDGSLGLIPEEWLARYGLLAGLGDAHDDHVRFRRTQVGLLDALLAAEPEASCDEVFERARKEVLQFAGVAPVDPSGDFRGDLRPYQKEGLGWLEFLQRFGFGGCLADDMGLGKTVQVLALLEARRAGGATRPSLVVVPKSLIFNWHQEAVRFAPQLRVLDYTGAARRGRAYDFADYDVILTTYGTLRADIAKLKNQRFDYAILDEAQAIKNAQSASAKAARLLKADHRLALSGTPIENRLSELWSLFEFLNPGMLGAAAVFQTLSARTAGTDDDGRRILAQALRPFLLRRTKDQVLTELPPKVEQTLYCELEPKQRKLYDELRDHYRAALLTRIDRDGIGRAKIAILEALLRLRQAAIHPGLIDRARADEPSAKLELLLPRLQELRDEGQKTLVFSQFTTMLGFVRRHLDEAGVPYEYLDGQTKNREERVARFQNERDCRLFLVSLKAGGLGLNLTAAQYVFLLDPWWNPAVEAQAIDRAHRMGQTKHVFAYRLIARDTIEEKILALQNDKRGLADAIINADNALIRTLSREDLSLLLS